MQVGVLPWEIASPTPGAGISWMKILINITVLARFLKSTILEMIGPGLQHICASGLYIESSKKVPVFKLNGVGLIPK